MRLIFLLIITLLLNLPALGEELFISSAMGAKELISEVGKEFEKKTGHRLIFNFSSSGKLASQIEAGAPADVYISASKEWMEYLIEKGLIEKGNSQPFAKTSLVLVTPKNSKLSSLEEAGRIAVGDRLAPVGKYTLETLKKLGLYEKLKGKLIFAPTVRQITIWTVTGNVDAGIIFYSDYLKFKNKLRLLKTFPDNLHSPIKFYVGVVSSSKKGELAKEFVQFLLSQDERKLRKFGFLKVNGSK